MSDTFTWLIERDNGTERQGIAEWWTGDALHLWTTDANGAVRFARKEDAERVINGHGELRPARATEHGWMAGLSAARGGAPAVPSEAAYRAFDTELDLLLWHEHRVNMNRDGKVAKALVANRDESRRRLTELFKARMGALEAALRGLACHCCADPEGHEATDHLTFGEREVFEQVRGSLAPAPSGPTK